jgi:hypothetical protein
MKDSHIKADYPTARDHYHGRSYDIVLVEISGDVEIRILRLTVAITNETSLSSRFITLSEWKMIVAIPAAKRRNMITLEFLQETVVIISGKEDQFSTVACNCSSVEGIWA